MADSPIDNDSAGSLRGRRRANERRRRPKAGEVMLPFRLKLYVLAVVAAGALSLAWWHAIWPAGAGWMWPGAQAQPGPETFSWTAALGARTQALLLPLSFAALIAGALVFPVRLTAGFVLTVDLGAKFAALLLFGPTVALVAAGAGTAAANLVQAARGRRNAWNVAFNTGESLVGLGLAGAVTYAGAPQQAPLSIDGPGRLVAVLGAGGCLYLVNALAVAAAVGLHRREHPLAVWRRGWRVEVEHSLFLLLVGILAALLVRHYPWTLGALALLMALAYRSQKAAVHLLACERAARREAEQATRVRAEFLAVASHELRTPVTSLHGYTQLLLRQYARNQAPSPERLLRALRAIDQQSNKLTRLVSQLLDVSRLQTGTLELDRRPTDLVALLEAVVATVRPTTDHRLVVHRMVVRRTAGPGTTPAAEEETAMAGKRGAEPAVPAPVWAVVDALRMEQVVINLIDNAIRYGQSEGPIELELGQVSPGAVQLAVRDYGAGIPPEHRQHVFDRFYQAGGSRHSGGMGLGLYISRQIVEAHGGHIDVETPPDGGTRFVITLPEVVTPPADQPADDRIVA